MTRKTATFQLTDADARKISELEAAGFGTKTDIFRTALDRMHQQEIKTMNTATQTITIKKIDTMPEHDPYVNIEGITSRTFLKLDPEARAVWVTQEYKDNSTPSAEWHGLVRTWCVNSHPSEAGMREWIDDNMATLNTICNGFERRWNGNNHVGGYSDEALAAIESIEFDFDNDAGPLNYYETWSVESWMEQSMSEITAEMTDEQLKDFAESAAITDDGTIILGDILDYITKRRDNLLREKEVYGDDE